MSRTTGTDADPSVPVGDPTRRRFLRGAAAASLVPLLHPTVWARPRAQEADPADGGSPRHPNVLFVFSDSHRAMSLGCYGEKQLRTPSFDGLAAQGARYATAVSNTPQCRPYRASLMAGSLAHRTGILAQKSEQNFNLDGENWTPKGLPTLGAEFARSGYRCGYVGKWHLGDPHVGPGPRRLGFDDFWRIPTEPHDYFEVTYISGEDTTVEGTGRFRPVAETHMAIDFMKQSQAADADRPWLCVLSWGPPHSPFRPPRRFRIEGPVEIPENVPKELRREISRTWLPLYHGLIEALDFQFARLLDALGELGIADDTIVVYTSDHGQLLGSHGIMGKNLPFSASSQVPLLVRWPGQIEAGRVVSRPFGTPDILPTLLGLAGLPGPAGLDGRDRSGELLGESPETGPADAYLTGHEVTGDFAVTSWKGLRTERYLYARSERAPWILYDLAEDPGELVNLVGKDEARTQELDALTLQRMQQLGDEWR